MSKLYAQRSHLLGAGFATSLLLLVTGAPLADVEIASSPLIVAEPLAPNIFFLLDDSGSMNRDDLPDTTNCSAGVGGDANNVILLSTGKLRSSVTARCQSPDFNKIYYNPSFTYTVPVNEAGNTLGTSSFTAAWRNGYVATRDSAVTDLSNWTPATWTSSRSTYTSGWVCTTRSGSSPNYSYSGCNTATPSASIYGYQRLTSGEFSYYRLRSGRTPGSTNDADYEKVIAATDEYENVANWYSYYRTRLYTARAGTSLAFDGIPDHYRIGYGSINYPYNSTYSTKISGVRPYASLRSNFYSWLFSVTPATSTYYYTPLRRALNNVGLYYESAEPWRLDPENTGSTEYSCRSCFTILMTDGYWTGGTTYQATTSAARANNDGTSGSQITGPNSQSYTYTATSTFSDNYLNTLADVAMYYWKRDLRPTLTNNITVSETDPAFWQHMVTIGIGLGVDGTITKQAAFDALTAGTAISWPNPLSPDSADSSSNPSKIDDLLHAAVNSHGLFFSAKSSREFTEGLKQSLATIASRLSSGTGLAIDSTTTVEGAAIFKATFRSVVWAGELAAYTLDSDGNAGDTATWLASARLPAFGDRHIFTRVDGTATDFTWANLNAAQRTALGTETVLNYLRGDQSLEVANNGTLRTRNSPLGDIVNSNPVYIGAPFANLFKKRSFAGAAVHDDFALAHQERIPMIYVGANDGMLHGFFAAENDSEYCIEDQEIGCEAFAYLPEALINTDLATLADPDYSHRYFVDGELGVADAYVNNAWKTILVGSLGRGGKALYAIDVTNPASVGASQMLWEVSPTTLGQNLGKPLIGRLPNGTWVAAVGNGYNSANHQAALLTVNLATAGVTTISTATGSADDPNGLAAAYLWDANNDGSFERAYAGDLQGNVWRFDLVNNSVVKLFQARDGSGARQPITAGVRVSKDPDTGKTWVFFGTGRFLSTGDPASRQVQTWYGLIDDGTEISGRGNLVQRSILAEGAVGMAKARTISAGEAADLVNKRGWYLDLIVGGNAQGERMVLPNQIYANILIGLTLIPVGDICNPEGDGFIMAIDPFTGARLAEDFFDYNGDGDIGEGDWLNGIAGSGISFNGIPSIPVFVGDKMIVQTHEGNVHTLPVRNPFPPGETERIEWHELMSN
jgi:type IV pilus assembly protein PilY1